VYGRLGGRLIREGGSNQPLDVESRFCLIMVGARRTAISTRVTGQLTDARRIDVEACRRSIVVCGAGCCPTLVERSVAVLRGFPIGIGVRWCAHRDHHTSTAVLVCTARSCLRPLHQRHRLPRIGCIGWPRRERLPVAGSKCEETDDNSLRMRAVPEERALNTERSVRCMRGRTSPHVHDKRRPDARDAIEMSLVARCEFVPAW
jgi:hypothetical protein